MSQSLNRFPLLSLACAAGLLLGGCGANDALVITGTAAKGAPLAGTVAATCASGSGTATVQSDGSYRVEVEDGAGPCLLTLTPSGGGTPLYSFTTGTGSQATANITPLTNMFVTFLLKVPGDTGGATTPSEWFQKAETRTYLASTALVQERATRDFLPVVRQQSGLGTTDVPSSLEFLSTSFVANPSQSTQDALLEKLSGTRAGATPIFQSNGTPTPAAQQQAETAAVNSPPTVVTNTGAQG
jgi:hypothetical protein